MMKFSIEYKTKDNGNFFLKQPQHYLTLLMIKYTTQKHTQQMQQSAEWMLHYHHLGFIYSKSEDAA